MIIDGKDIAAKRLEELRTKVKGLRSKPKLVAIIVGEDPASKMYVSMKAKKAGEVGIGSEIIELTKLTKLTELTKQIGELNKDKSVTGILVQLPFPKDSQVFSHELEVLEAIDPIKDVDCLTSVNMGLIAIGKPRYYPATVKAVLIALSEALKLQKIEESFDWNLLAGKKATVVGRSDIVGKPIAMALISLGATVTVCNSKTRDLSLVTSHSDILISATGVPHLITADMVKDGAVVIDVGINPQSDGKIVGDVDFDEVSKIASAITPVPGGVGPLTISSLLENTVEAYEQSRK